MKRYLFLTLFLMFAAAMQAQSVGKQERDTLYRLTIRYLYEDNGNVAAPAYSHKFSLGEQYNVTSPNVPGYHPDKATVQGVMPRYDVIDTVLYAKNVHRVTVDPNITHGEVFAEPDGQVEVGETVYIEATPDQGYILKSINVYEKGNVNNTVSVIGNVFIMPDFDVVVSAVFVLDLPLPEINGEIVAPDAICSGHVLELTAPTVANADEQGWEMAEDEQFAYAVAYTGQALDASYNGWKLRFWASNTTGTVVSNTVTIRVHHFEPVLTGDQQLCTMQMGTYTVASVGNATLTWTVSDSDAILTESGKTLKVRWATAGTHTVSLTAENEETGCVATVELFVTVTSYVDSSEIHDLVAKKHDGKDYILIYPNPKDTYKYQWYKDNEAIKGAHGQYLYQQGGLDAGVYKVYLSYNADAEGNLFGGAFSGTYTVSTATTFILCPNPAQHGSEIHVLNASGGEALVSILTLDGRLLHQQTVNGTNAVLNISLPQGLYVVQWNDSQNEYIEKLIVK